MDIIARTPAKSLAHFSCVTCIMCYRRRRLELSNLMIFKLSVWQQRLGKPWRRRRDSNPRYRIYQYDGLANRWFQPLTQLSGSQRRSADYSDETQGPQGALTQKCAAHRMPHRDSIGITS